MKAGRKRPLVMLFVGAMAILPMGLGSAVATAASPEARVARSTPTPDLLIDHYGKGKPREIHTNDWGTDNDPDNDQSLHRRLLYANEVDLEGIVWASGMWTATDPPGQTEVPMGIIDAYGAVWPNLVKHDPAFPSPAYLKSIFAIGQREMDQFGKGQPTSAGAELIISRVDAPDPRPLWVTMGGGASTLAQALYVVRETRTPQQVDAFVRKLRAYSIGDQDNAAQWIRKEFPTLFWIGSPSVINAAPIGGSSDDYRNSTWTGISGEAFFRPTTVFQGPNTMLTSQPWLKAFIQSKGSYGAAYVDHLLIMEGDSPAWMGLIQNGLAGHANPSWGGWGGRYIYRRPEAGPTQETRPFFTQGPGTADTVVGFDGLPHTDDFATIYRWREAFQYDFAVRMDWTLSGDYASANHEPRVTVNGTSGSGPLFITAKPGQPVTLDAAGTTDPDGDQLSYRWFNYKEAGRTETAEPVPVELSGAAAIPLPVDVLATTGQKVTVTGTKPGQAHVILEAKDNGKGFPLTSYRRVVITIADTKAAPHSPVMTPVGRSAPVTDVRPGRALPATGGSAGAAAFALVLVTAAWLTRRRLRTLATLVD